VYIDGEPVVDLWDGYCDATYTRPWERDTIVQTFSTTKTMTALVALVLADNGVLDLDAPVVRYWPEFGAEAKSEILVRQILDYTRPRQRSWDCCRAVGPGQRWRVRQETAFQHRAGAGAAERDRRRRRDARHAASVGAGLRTGLADGDELRAAHRLLGR
jgi:hypothetical protein